ncbi:hypothetical protein [Ruegeria profundi]|uniref:hypothetical protein n=1 Tax=Ruegeria profundi TaxID=1685378 RepID=UPI001969B170|nr:hypothetical protein [Ruegeria profundi]
MTPNSAPIDWAEIGAFARLRISMISNSLSPRRIWGPFDIEGGWFAIVSRDRYAPGAEPGSGAVPYLQAADLEVLQSRVVATGAAAPEIIKEPGIHLLKITDPNGQLIEFFKLTGK